MSSFRIGNPIFHKPRIQGHFCNLPELRGAVYNYRPCLPPADGAVLFSHLTPPNKKQNRIKTPLKPRKITVQKSKEFKQINFPYRINAPKTF